MVCAFWYMSWTGVHICLDCRQRSKDNQPVPRTFIPTNLIPHACMLAKGCYSESVKTFLRSFRENYLLESRYTVFESQIPQYNACCLYTHTVESQHSSTHLHQRAPVMNLMMRAFYSATEELDEPVEHHPIASYSLLRPTAWNHPNVCDCMHACSLGVIRAI